MPEDNNQDDMNEAWIEDVNPVSGQIAYTMVAVSSLTWACLDMYRYKSGTTWDAFMVTTD